MERLPVFSMCKKNLHIGATFVVKLRIQDLFAADHDNGRRENWHPGVGLGFLGAVFECHIQRCKGIIDRS